MLKNFSSFCLGNLPCVISEIPRMLSSENPVAFPTEIYVEIVQKFWKSSINFPSKSFMDFLKNCLQESLLRISWKISWDISSQIPSENLLSGYLINSFRNSLSFILYVLFIESLSEYPLQIFFTKSSIHEHWTSSTDPSRDCSMDSYKKKSCVHFLRNPSVNCPDISSFLSTKILWLL